ncbi:phage distal tail protein, Rcc01695 family [Xanthobacter sp. TB0136]|uniref:phage distal tail protein, Rcc01695 family n=1 Tax=Xanthobacter sp. TB0136 TaxID=3459177 RepID=UPI004039CF72
MSAFHEILFPLDIALGAAGGPERVTQVVTTASGREERNTRLADSRRRWDAGYGVKNLAALSEVVAFFEERRGRLYGFRWRDRLDHSSAPPAVQISPRDQHIGHGDGARRSFSLSKTYGGMHAPYVRPISKPVQGSVRIAVEEVEQVAGTDFTVDYTTGTVLFAEERAPPEGAMVTAGFMFDVPVRFDTDFLEVNLSAFAAGDIPRIPLIEIRP